MRHQDAVDPRSVSFSGSQQLIYFLSAQTHVHQQSHFMILHEQRIALLNRSPAL